MEIPELVSAGLVYVEQGGITQIELLVHMHVGEAERAEHLQWLET